jgi:manganese/zinc/iron transport system substrate-binding protein
MKLTLEAFVRATTFILLFAVGAIFFAGCKTGENRTPSAVWMQNNGKLKILCITAMCQDLVESIAGDAADCLTLIKGESDPHSYQLVKGDDEKFARADIIFSSGLGLEHGPSLRALLHKNPKAFSLGDFLALHYPEEVIFVDNTPDPHIWMDVALWSKSIPFIARVLAERAPGKEQQIGLRASSLQGKLQEVEAKIQQAFAKLRESQKYLITTHSSCNYFARAYLSTPKEQKDGSWRKRCTAPEGLSPESQLSTADIQRLLLYIEEHDVRVAFIESNVNYDSLKKVSEIMKKKAKPFYICTEPLYTDAMGSKESGAGSYSSMMLYDALVISKNLARHGT